MNIPFATFEKMHQAIRPEMKEAFEKVYDKGWFIQGEECEAFDSNKLLSHEIRAEADTIMIRTLLDNWDTIDNIIGGAIYIDSKIVAYTIADLSMRDTIVVHSERGDRDYKGSYQAINRLFLENLIDRDNRFKFVNREQDVGDLGLRKAKMSYNPVGYIEKYKGFCTEL